MIVYLAASLKDMGQRARNKHIATMIENKYQGGISKPNVYLPQDYMVLKSDATQDDRANVYHDNMNMIRRADLMIAILDDKDSGVIYEMGGRGMLGQPMMALYTNPVPNINVMLTMGCVAVCNGIREFEIWMANPKTKPYTGRTE